MDGAQGGVLANTVREVFANPWMLDDSATKADPESESAEEAEEVEQPEKVAAEAPA
jgi:hypothetical protein